MLVFWDVGSTEGEGERFYGNRKVKIANAGRHVLYVLSLQERAIERKERYEKSIKSLRSP